MLRERIQVLRFGMAWVLFFDGACGLCSKTVRTVHRLDHDSQIEFAPLQGELSSSLGLVKYLAGPGGTVVLVCESNGQHFYKSDAVIQIGRIVGGGWAWASTILALVPRCLRDACYGVVARNRHRFFGDSGVCEIADESLQRKLRN